MQCNYKVYENAQNDSMFDFNTQLLILQEEQKHCHYHEVTRPEISFKTDFLPSLLRILLLAVAEFILLKYFNIFSAVAFLLIWNVLFLKKTLIFLILLYQKYAPEFVRASCVFEPCCSEYMKLSIEKYGTIKGLFKGIKRLFRCHYPNGGIDVP